MMHKTLKIIAQSWVLSMPLFAISMDGNSNPSAASTTATPAANQASNNGAAAPSITSSNLTRIKLQIPGDKQAPVLLPSVAIGLSAVLKAQAGLADSMTNNRDLFIIEPIEEHGLLEKFVQLMKLFAMQKNQPIITDMAHAYSLDATKNHSVAINRLLERLEIRDLLQVLHASLLVGLKDNFNQVVVFHIARKLTEKQTMQQCFTEPDLFDFVFDNFPQNLVPVLTRELLAQSGYLLWGCLGNLVRLYSGKFNGFSPNSPSLQLSNLSTPKLAFADFSTYPKFAFFSTQNGKLIIKSKKNGAILSTTDIPDGCTRCHIVLRGQEKFYVLMIHRGELSSVVITDTATKKEICTINSLKQNIQGSIHMSDNNLVICLKDSDALNGIEISTIVNHLSVKQIYFLMLTEHAYLNNLPVSICSHAVLEAVYESLDQEIREFHFDVRYKRLLQPTPVVQAARSNCIIS